MNNLPTFKDIWVFLKDNKRTIIFTMIISFVLYGLGIGYTLYTDSKVEKADSESVEDSSNLPKNPLTTEEIKKLEEKQVAFEFYIENNSAEQFTNYNLMKQILISPSSLKYIEEKIGFKIEPNPIYVVNMSLDHSTYVLTLTIGTGNDKKNMEIAQAYYEGIENGDISFFGNNKSIYMVSVPKVTTSEQLNGAAESTHESNGNTSITTIIALAIAGLIATFVLGIIVALIKTLTAKEITDAFSYTQKPSDTFLNLNSLDLNSESNDKRESLVHAIRYPKKPVKVILSEHPIEKDIQNELNTPTKITEDSSSIKELTKEFIALATDVNEIDLDVEPNEVVILCEKSRTTKKWYARQRTLLESYKAEVKIILF